MLTCLFLLSTMISDVADKSIKNPDIAKHEEMLNRIKSIHIKMETHYKISQNENFKPSWNLEIWKSGDKLRVKNKIFYIYSPSGPITYKEDEAPIYEHSIDGVIARNMDTRDTMAKYSGTFSKRKPAPVFISEWSHILLNPHLNYSLIDLMKYSKYEKKNQIITKLPVIQF